MIRLYVRTNGGALSVFAESSPRRVVGVGVGHTHHARLLLAPWEAMRMIMRFTPCSIAAPLRPSLGASCAPQMVAGWGRKRVGPRPPHQLANLEVCLQLFIRQVDA